MLDTRQIHPLTDFLRHHKAHLARLKETKTPEILTVNGRAEVVIQDVESYQALLDRLHHMGRPSPLFRRAWRVRSAAN